MDEEYDAIVLGTGLKVNVGPTASHRRLDASFLRSRLISNAYVAVSLCLGMHPFGHVVGFGQESVAH